MADSSLNATLVGRHDLSPSTARFEILPDRPEPIPFEPGQFLSVGLPKPEADLSPVARRRGRTPMTRRAYTLLEAPAKGGPVEFLVDRVPEGRLTPRLWTLEENDRLFLDPRPKGHFTLEQVPAGRRLVGVATGAGIAPFLAYARAGAAAGRAMTVIHAVAETGAGAFADEFEAAGADYVLIIGDQPGWPAVADRVREAIGAVSPDPSDTHLFLCGDPAMIDETESRALEAGFTTDTASRRGTVRSERYW